MGASFVSYSQRYHLATVHHFKSCTYACNIPVCNLDYNRVKTSICSLIIVYTWSLCDLSSVGNVIGDTYYSIILVCFEDAVTPITLPDDAAHSETPFEGCGAVVGVYVTIELGQAVIGILSG